MAENSAGTPDDKSDKGEIRIKAGRRTIPLTCIGNVCFDPDTGKIVVELERDKCPEHVIKNIVENIVKGAETEFVIPKREPETPKE